MEEKKLLNTASGLDMLGGDKSLYQMLITSFLTEAPFDDRHLDSLIASGKNDEAGSYVHRCKGAAGQIGAEKLHDEGQTFEDVLKGRKRGDVKSLHASFLAVYEATVRELSQYRTQL
ncbi:MAG: Hpt domain-containing protein [Treponema sp.]|nr:Hpt domain-containing protein [Treponema sp.]